MYRINLVKDIHSLSEFRAHATSFIKQLRKNKRPLVITQHGKTSAIILDVSEYENLLEQIDLVEDIRTARKEIKNEKGISHDSAQKILMDRLDT
ncbi:MAG: type II toxin-antitoxin system Phd/YefM family antitoxin [Candidatus Omnitrophica bacterium]|nr:type II toxin-antitoxin system Phd/YefM family antitoxin [Candidatus Omnitrophota bacterium]